MKKEYLIAVDLEGIHGVVGEPYKALSPEIPDYKVACENAVKEINCVVDALFAAGAGKVAVWDNHSSGKNLDFTKIDPHAVRVENPPMPRYERFSFAKEFHFAGIFLLGYHSKEGSFNGVLAHTYNSRLIQYFKIGGKTMGEAEIDAYIAGSLGIPVLFCASDDVCVAQVRESIPGIHTVVTKIGKGRNAADLLEEEKVLKEIYEKATEALRTPAQPVVLSYPTEIEMNYSRAETAADVLKKVRGYGQEVRYGETTHILHSVLHNAKELEAFI